MGGYPDNWEETVVGSPFGMIDFERLPCLSLVSERSMAERLRPGCAAPHLQPQPSERPWRRGPRPGGQVAARLAQPSTALGEPSEQEDDRLPPAIRYVVGLDGAKSAPVFSALEAPSGTVRLAEHADLADGRRLSPTDPFPPPLPPANATP